MLGWSAGQMLVGVWLQTLVLFVLVVVAALVIAAKTHWLVFLLAIPLVGFVAFVLSRFIDLFGMFAWGAWAEEQGLKIRILSFNPFRNLPHFAARVTEVLPLWQVSVIVALETLIILPLLATKPNDAGHFVPTFRNFQSQDICQPFCAPDRNNTCQFFRRRARHHADLIGPVIGHRSDCLDTGASRQTCRSSISISPPA